MKYEEKIELLIRSGSKIIQIVSYEWKRIYGAINKASQNLNREWYSWSDVKGLRKWDSKKQTFINVDSDLVDAYAILENYETNQGDFIYVLEDFHPYLNERNNKIVRYLREITRLADNKTIILAQPFKRIPDELNKEISLIEIELPKIETLSTLVDNVVDDYEGIFVDITDKLLSSALGLSIMEAETAFRKAIIKNGKLTESEIPLIIAEKENIIKKNGLLEYYHPKEELDSIGGLENLKQWVSDRGNAFGKSAKDYGLNTPKGVLLLGIPGCGKSLTAKVIAKTWNFPLLRFDLGKVFGGIVGESERNIREALDVAKALSPCVLWIDEIEKGLSGVQSSGQTDGGTTSRVFGTFLTWMQEKEEPVFVVATANDISLLPPELLRKGRFDEIFFVDLPTLEERVNIFKIHLEKKNRDPFNYDLEYLANESQGFTGAEIEGIVNESLYYSFNKHKDLSTDDMIETIRKTSPLSKTMAENINSLRKWAKVRARLASVVNNEELEVSKEIPKLKQETKNPFI